ncbi:SMI1/KNR4 family protein [Paenibacillus sp. FSL L8-0436]|uniref:SMI1/KNR4 family protein n=1 Tax=Paenibacillus sp. FSL L8-0436 TaxID=2954686 RepID=UPI0031596A1C
MTEKAETLWQRIIAKGSRNTPGYEANLNLQPGASVEELDGLASTLEVVLPQELRDFYSIYNGQDWEAGSECFVRNLTLSPLEQIIEHWEFLNEEFDPDDMEPEIVPQIKPFLWNPRWIPIASNGGGDHFCVDTDPSEEGTFGQLLYFYHDWGNRSVEAAGLFDFIEQCLNEEE